MSQTEPCAPTTDPARGVVRVQEVPKSHRLEKKNLKNIYIHSYKMLLWLDSPQPFGDARFVTNTECRTFLLVVGFPTPAEYYNPPLKTLSASSVFHRVPPTAEIIAFSKNAVFFERKVF